MTTRHIARMAAAILLAVSTAEAAIINVPGDEPTIQHGINAAMNGDEVVVAQGEYFQNINFNGKAITLRSTDPLDPMVVANTIINGGGLGSVVTCGNGEGPDSVLSGFVITGGSAAGGGGMLNQNGSSPTVNNCIFSGNTASSSGGGMLNATNCNPMVSNCSFSGNSADIFGGGMANTSLSNPTVSNCSFSGNTGSGGMFNLVSHPTVTNCTFTGNSSDTGGGGMQNSSSNPTVSNCTFSGNSTPGSGGGMYNVSSSSTVIDCVFIGNEAGNNGGGMSNFSSHSTTVTNTRICENTPNQTQGPFTDGGGNCIADSCDECCLWDCGDSDGTVGIVDFLALLAQWGGPGSCDFDGGGVGITDFLDLLANWGQCP